MGKYILENGFIVTDQTALRGTVVIDGEKITAVHYDKRPERGKGFTVIDLDGKLLLPGVIDAHVHFREPGMTHKGDLESESKAALLGGVTSFIDMPNTKPATVSGETLLEKLELARGRCWSNYGFHIGATNDNIQEIRQLIKDCPELFAGVKVFMGSSTGNMLVNSQSALEELFAMKGKPVLVHSEDEARIRANLAARTEEIPFSEHPRIRDSKACILSTIRALEMAVKYGTQLHLLHISTKEEVQIVAAAKRHNPNITCESSANYMWFSDNDYGRLGALVKCNPAIKAEDDRLAILEGFREGLIDTVGSDHAPHLLSEKGVPYRKCPSGIPSVAHQLPALLTLAVRHGIPLQRIASAFCAKPAQILGIKDRGRIASGFIADLVIADCNTEYSLSAPYKCGWSPYDKEKFTAGVESVFLGGELAVENGEITGRERGRQLSFCTPHLV